ncbi:retrotransposon ty3-gypsy subclass, partial [Cystoisospora suis]
ETPEGERFRLATAKEVAEGNKDVRGSKPNEESQKIPGNSPNESDCSIQQVRKWIKRGEVEAIFVALPEKVEEEQPDHPKEGVWAVEEAGADVCPEIPPGGVMERPQKHHIPTVPGEMPTYKKQTYAMSEDHLRELKELLRVLLEKGFIVPSNSPIAAPVFFVGKKGNEKLRMVIDYRGLNRITIKDDYPIPRINDLVNRLGKGSWFCKLDLASGYYQVQVAEQDQWKTTFQTRYGTFQFKVMPFGLAGAPSTFQRMMQHVFIRELDEFVIVYLDDVLVYSRSRLEHYNHLRIVLQRLRENRLYVGVTKCEFVKQKVQYLGFIIEPGGIAPDPDKVTTIREWPVELRDRKQLRGFLGMIGYYRRLIPNFNKTASKLYGVLQEKSDMIWWPKHTRAVETLKSDLAEVTQVKLFDPDKDFVIKTDASKYAVGAVLEQDGQIIAFESRKLGPREQRLPAYEAALLAIVHALMKWKHFIGDRKVTV